MNVERKLDELGRIVIPIEIRRAWGVTAGNTLLLTSTPDGALRITPAQRRCSLCHQPGAEGVPYFFFNCGLSKIVYLIVSFHLIFLSF